MRAGLSLELSGFGSLRLIGVLESRGSVSRALQGSTLKLRFAFFFERLFRV